MEQEKLDSIRRCYRGRQDYTRAAQRIENQMFGICMRVCNDPPGVKTFDQLKKEAGELLRDVLKKAQDDDSATVIATRSYLTHLNATRLDLIKEAGEWERKLAAETETLPAYGWVKETPGAGLWGFGAIIAEAGDLNNYPTVRHLWKRMGLAVIDGRAQRKCTDKELASLHGYSPRRRSLMYTLGGPFVKQTGKRKNTRRSPYRDIYEQRRATLAARGQEKGLDHHSQRYLEKCYLRDLFWKWREATA